MSEAVNHIKSCSLGQWQMLVPWMPAQRTLLPGRNIGRSPEIAALIRPALSATTGHNITAVVVSPCASRSSPLPGTSTTRPFPPCASRSPLHHPARSAPARKLTACTVSPCAPCTAQTQTSPPCPPSSCSCQPATAALPCAPASAVQPLSSPSCPPTCPAFPRRLAAPVCPQAHPAAVWPGPAAHPAFLLVMGARGASDSSGLS